MKRFYGDRFRLAPLTVLVDAARERDLLSRPDSDVTYLFQKQIAEADLVRYTKGDLYPEIPGALSAHTGRGVGEWLNDVLASAIPAGARLLEIDYRRYAAAEAALGWLNWEAEVALRRPLTPAAVAGPLLDRLDRALTGSGISIAHLKVFVEAPTGHLKAGICRNGDAPAVEGALDAAPAVRHKLLVNLRAEGRPEALETILDGAVARVPGKWQVRHRQAFRPSPPEPEYRFSEVL
jgi:hypothetical protein